MQFKFQRHLKFLYPCHLLYFKTKCRLSFMFRNSVRLYRDSKNLKDFSKILLH